MKTFAKCLIVAIVLISSQTSFDQTLDEFIEKAENSDQACNLEQAPTVMEEAIKQYPDSSTAYSYLGLYRGMQAR